MSKFIINGARVLKGEVRVNGSKNATLPIIAASLLIPEVRLKNVPRILDVEVMLEIIKSLGGDYEWVGEHELYLSSAKVENAAVTDNARKLRASIALAGPLLARFKEARLSYPGGDIIGARPLDTHLNAFRDLGVEVTEESDLHFTTSDHHGGSIVLEEASVLATENIIIYAAGIDKPVKIKLAAVEPHVQDLCHFLIKAGAKIGGIGTTTLEIQGSKNLQSISHTIIPDDIEVGSFAALAAVTHSDILLNSVDHTYLDSVLLQLKKMNVNFEIEENTLHILSPLGAYKAFRLQSGFYPKLLSDHIPPLAVLATQAEGTTLVHDWLYEGRQGYIRELIKMGANATIMDPHRALIIGPTPLYGKEVVSLDIRSGMAMIVAALTAEGRTVISEAQHIDRGYENLEARLRALGADIVRED